MKQYSSNSITIFKIISLVLITLIFCASSCSTSTTIPEPETKVNEEAKPEPVIDRKKARELSDNLANAIIKDNDKEIYAIMEKRFRDYAAEKDVRPILDKLYRAYGKPMEVEYKKVDVGSEIYNGQMRSVNKFWYAVKTSTEEKGKYFLNVNIILDGDSLGCSVFGIVSFTNGVPPDLR